ncbi:MAG TPA: phage antirepressor KilAC domain-containing protein, partial [Beutenbergiaceae bacterium]|nr:phage antirepressor KilAC domain-containing protein [Beutenbergiaceae bacterium]
IETMAPRVELLELFEDKREGFSIGDTGALFGYKPFQFHEVMRTWGATHRNQHGNTLPSKFWVDKGWLKARNAVTPAVTPMGLAEIERRLGRKAVG